MNEKVCTHCAVSKPLWDYAWANKEKTRFRGDCKVCTSSKQKDRAERHKQENLEAWTENRIAIQRLHRYGVTRDMFSQMLKDQDGCCSICKDELIVVGQKYAIDHDHSHCPGRKACVQCVRGILCSSCNRLLGSCRDRVDILKAAIAFLEEGARPLF